MTSSPPFSPGSQICAYLRDSGGSDQDLSVNQQEGELRAWCLTSGLVLTQIFKDVASPGSSVVGREAFLEMVRYLRGRGRPERGVIIWKFSRFARDIDDAQYFKADLRRRGYEIYSIKDPVPEGSTGRFFESALDWMNQRFLEDLSADVRRGLHHLVREYGAMPGTPPLGFIRQMQTIGERRSGSPHVVARWLPTPDADLRGRIQLAWEMRAAGASLIDIHKMTELYGSLNSYTTFFRNSLYKGELHYGDQVVAKYCEPVVDPETWDQVQIINQASARVRSKAGEDSPEHPHRQASPYLLSGLAHCARCGSLLVGGSFFSAHDQARRYYYQCGKANRSRTCDLRKIPKDFLEDAVLATLADYILDPDVIAAQHKLLEQKEAQEEDPQTRQELNKRLANLKRKIANVTESLAELGKSTALLDKLAELERQEAELHSRLKAMDTRRSAQVVRAANLEETQAMAAIVRQHFRHFDLLTQKKILKGLISRISVDRDGRLISGLIEYYQPPEDLLTDSGDLGEEPGKRYRYNLCPHREERYTCKFSVKFEYDIRRQF